MGRAGQIHLKVLSKASGAASVRWLVDVNPKLFLEAPDAQITSDIYDALADPAVDCVIISTPTPSHAPLIKLALNAGKHVFAEKPLCCGSASEVAELFQLAEGKGLLLHTAYNRRHDPMILEARQKMRSGVHGRPLGATLVSRDYPYPPASYLALSGNIFKDCVVHDLDYLTWLLDDHVVALRATASTGADAQAQERACGMWEYSEVHLTLSSGATATLINGRVSNSYEHRLDIYCEHGAVRVANPFDKPGFAPQGTAFSDRFAASYHAQLSAFRAGVRAVMAGAVPTPNLDLARTLLLEQMVLACEKSVAQGGAKVYLPNEVRSYRRLQGALLNEALSSSPSTSECSSPRSVDGTKVTVVEHDITVDGATWRVEGVAYKLEEEAAPTEGRPNDRAPVETDDLTGAAAAAPAAPPPAPQAALRTYDEQTAAAVKALYREMRAQQSVEHVRLCRAKYCAGLGEKVKMSVWDALELLARFVDVSDPDVSLPNQMHAYQTAEGLRAMNLPDWLQLTGLIHDLGKMMAFVKGCDEDGTSVATQWSIVGDTWVVGCAMPATLVFPEYNGLSPDAQHPERCTQLGIYAPGCGLDATLVAFGHDEYLYQVLAQQQWRGVKLPKEALYIIRYHSLYAWHDKGEYEALESEYDRNMKGWVKLFNQHDLYTKKNVKYTEAELSEMRAYYSGLVDKYLPAELNW